MSPSLWSLLVSLVTAPLVIRPGPPASSFSSPSASSSSSSSASKRRHSGAAVKVALTVDALANLRVGSKDVGRDVFDVWRAVFTQPKQV